MQKQVEGPGYHLELTLYAGELAFTVADLTVSPAARKRLGALPYDPAAHRHWALRETAGTVYFETSADGQSFVTRAFVPAPAAVTAVHVELHAGVDAKLAAGASAAFDDLNLP